ncbi:hypothetical protein Unana1_08894 [Umbelopsis nana]
MTWNHGTVISGDQPLRWSEFWQAYLYCEEWKYVSYMYVIEKKYLPKVENDWEIQHPDVIVRGFATAIDGFKVGGPDIHNISSCYCSLVKVLEVKLWKEGEERYDAEHDSRLEVYFVHVAKCEERDGMHEVM